MQAQKVAYEHRKIKRCKLDTLANEMLLDVGKRVESVHDTIELPKIFRAQPVLKQLLIGICKLLGPIPSSFCSPDARSEYVRLSSHSSIWSVFCSVPPRHSHKIDFSIYVKKRSERQRHTELLLSIKANEDTQAATIVLQRRRSCEKQKKIKMYRCDGVVVTKIILTVGKVCCVCCWAARQIKQNQYSVGNQLDFLITHL